MDELKILTYNAQGLGGISKRTDVLDYLKNMNFDIYCLQDTHFTESDEKLIRNLWDNDCIFSNFRSNARGVAILFNKNLNYNIHNQISDNLGNYIILDISIHNQHFSLINIYGPNTDNPKFFQEIFQKVDDIGNTDFIICGDFNLILDPNKDCSNYKHVNNPKARDRVLKFIDEKNAIDMFRETNPELKRYTWRKRNPLKQARLDFFLTSENIIQFVKQCKIESSYRSDHSAVSLLLSFTNIEHGKSYWKHNNSLLTDMAYLNTMNKKIIEIKQQYALPVYNMDEIQNIPDNEIQFTINDQLFLEILLMELRGQSISYACFKNKQRNTREKELICEIADLENNINNENIERIDTLKMELLDLRQEKLKGQIIRSKAQYIDKGEKPTKYFCGLEKHNYITKTMHKLEKEDGTILTEQRDILKETETFYKHLYSNRDSTLDNVDLDEYIGNNSMNKLTKDQSDKLEGILTLTEISSTLKSMKSEKSPGLSGFSAEFFKVFWIHLGNFVLRSLNYGYLTGELSVSQKQGIITCIPKENKPKQFLKNWRPLTLLDTVYKIASGTIANRLKTVLDSIINRDQTGFIKGRSIVENIRTIYDIMKFTDDLNIPGLILLIDFEKAFDSLSLNFLHKALQHLNFGESLRKWVSVFYKNITSTVTQSGHLSSFFSISRGCRQGDPLSPYLFIICAEFLATKIRKNEKIKGIRVNDTEFLISQFADDTSIILDGTEKSLNQTLSELEIFSRISGLNVNFEKTQLVWIGSEKYSIRSIKTKWKLSWGKNTFKLLGINFNTNLEKMIQDNYATKIQQIEKIINIWNKRSLSPVGKITVIKTLLIPVFNLLFMSLPNPDQVVINTINEILYDFLWNKKAKIKKAIIVKQYFEGGLKMVNLQAFICALKATWIRRLITSNSKWQCYITSYISIEKLTAFDTGYVEEKLKDIKNHFWKDVLIALLKLKNNIKETQESVLKSPLFYSHNITIAGAKIFYKDWYSKGIRFINDMIKENGDFYSQQEIIKKTKIKINILHYYGIIKSIKAYLKKIKLTLTRNVETPFIPSHIYPILQQSTGAQTIYNILNKNDEKPTGMLSWNKKYNIHDDDWEKIFKDPFCITKYPAIQWFQTSINHNILVTNSLLYKMKLKNDPFCYYCHQHEETITHLFWQCDKIQQFLKELIQWLKSNNIKCDISEEYFILGLMKNNISEILRFILLYAKYYIYITRCNQQILVLNVYKRKLLLMFKIHMEISISNNKLAEFLDDWRPYQELIDSIV